MTLTGLHLLLTYQCNYQCDHCFVWGGPWQRGTMTLTTVEEILRQAKALGTIEWIYFEGGEPFLYYGVLIEALRRTKSAGFKAGIVSNAYWATDRADAIEWLRPMVGLVRDLSISSDLYHWTDTLESQTRNASEAAELLGIPLGVISIGGPAATAPAVQGQLPDGESAIMYRGRAADTLAVSAPRRPCTELVTCPHEDLREPGRVHLDAFGNVHICQGISIGNLFETPLGEICARYDPDGHPIAGPLLAGGPLGLARAYDVPIDDSYADECHLCFETRRAMRPAFPGILTPDQMYDEPAE